MSYAIGSAIMGSPDYAGMANRQEQQRQRYITQGQNQVNQAFSGFNQGFYNQRGQDYVNSAMPQLSQQYLQNRNQIGFGLGNRGLLASSAARNQWTGLGKEMGSAKQTIADQGIGYAQDLQKQVEQQKSVLYNQLYQSADPKSAGANAINVASGFQQPSVFQPLGNMFGNIANQYMLSQMINTYRPQNPSAQGWGAPSGAINSYGYYGK